MRFWLVNGRVDAWPSRAVRENFARTGVFDFQKSDFSAILEKNSNGIGSA